MDVLFYIFVASAVMFVVDVAFIVATFAAIIVGGEIWHRVSGVTVGVLCDGRHTSFFLVQQELGKIKPGDQLVVADW